jgi:hypothetical protein
VTIRAPLRRALLVLLAALPAIASCGESDDATALDLVIDPRATIDQIDIKSVTLGGQPLAVTDRHLLPHQPARLNNGDVLRLLFDDDKGGSVVVVVAVGLFENAEVTGPATATATLQTKKPVRATLVLGMGGAGGNGGGGAGGRGGSSGGGAGAVGSAGTTGAAGTGGSVGGGNGGSSAGGGAAGTVGGAGRGGTTGTAGTGGSSGGGGSVGAAGRGGTVGTAGTGGTSAGGRGGGTAGSGGATGMAGRGGTTGMAGRGGTTGTAGRGGTVGSAGTGGTATGGRGGNAGGAGGGAPRCMEGPLAQATAAQVDIALLGSGTDCGFAVTGTIVPYAALNGSRFAVIRELEFAQAAACGRCIRIDAGARTTIATVVGSCALIPGMCGPNSSVLLSQAAYGDVTNGQPMFPVTWSYVPCQVQGPVYARLDPTFTRVVILNHAHGIARVESFDPQTNQWITLIRAADNFWNLAFTLAGHMIRVTDVNGGVVTSATLQGVLTDQMLSAQLPMCVSQ